MPWPRGVPPDGVPITHPRARCAFMECVIVTTKWVTIITGSGRKVDRPVCFQHEKDIAEAVKIGLYLEVTQYDRMLPETSATIWINTIADFWYGHRRAA